MSLNKSLNSIGDEITACRFRCKAIMNDVEKGIYPRCFYPEICNEKLKYFDSIVIGLNPGIATPLERAFIKYIQSHKSNFGFEYIKIVMEPIIRNCDYYTRVRAFLNKYLEKKDLNILWTELVKCQSRLDDMGGKLPIELDTKKKCFEKFLKREIEIFTKYQKPLLILLGKEVFDFIKKYGKEQFVGFEYLKLYHPTGSRKFHSYFEDKNIKGKLISHIPMKEKFI